jgi:DNA-3-methyladenine glycosylase I
MASRPDRGDLKARLHADGRRRCAWCPDDALYVAYHDQEWGRASHDDAHLFEMLCLEGAQAGLSWSTVLNKRAHYRRVFDGFDAARMARYGAAKKRALLADAGIIRNRLKVDAFIDNARAYLALRESGRTLDEYLWSFTGGKVLKSRPHTLGLIATATPLSDAMSKDLKQKGFRFVGTTICYAFMQAVGIVDEHQRYCWVASQGKSR